MKRTSYRFLRYAALGIPLVLGVIGFRLAGEMFTDALFHSVSLYGMEYTDTPPNIWIEVSRWTAPLATVSGVFLALSTMRDRLHAFFCYRRGSSVAVYGPEEERTSALAQLGRRGVEGKQRFVRAQTYILLDNGGKNFAFCSRYRSRLRRSEVYLKCSTLSSQSVQAGNLHLFCPEETAARLFWKEKNLYPLSVRREHQLKIVFLGFGKLGEELLLHGLQSNIFSPDQRIAYHIFGDGAAFTSIHHQLERISDPICFYDQSWYTQLPLLEEADLVIVLEQSQQLALLENLLLATCRPHIEVFSAENAALELLAERERLTVFDWRKESQTPANILTDQLFLRAKGINLRYAHLYSGVEENKDTLREQWEKLNAFTRNSNISSADYHEVRLAMLSAMEQPTDANQLSPALLEQLAELEHIRWYRYHVLNNWRYGIPDNGARKDSQRRIHADLIPYQELTEEEKEKDRETIRILLNMPEFQ